MVDVRCRVFFASISIRARGAPPLGDEAPATDHCDPPHYISSFLAQRTSGPVVLVGHSYGGFVITNAASAGGDVRALVYLDAFVPDEGETVSRFSAVPGRRSTYRTRRPCSTWSDTRVGRRVTPRRS